MSVTSLSKSFISRLPTFPVVNKWFAFACSALPAALGSAVTLVYHAGALWCTLQVVSGRYRFSRDTAMIRMALCLYAYVAINLVSTLINGGPGNYWLVLLPLITFLGFPFSYSIWVVSHKDEIATATIVGSAVSCVAALLLAFGQAYVLDMRAEGGAGNALVFATVTSLSTSVVLAGLFWVDRRWTLPLCIAFACGLVAVIYSGSRLAWLATVLALGIVLLTHRRAVIQQLSARLIAMIVGTALLLVLISIVPLSERLGELWTDWVNLAEQGNYESSLGNRAALWQIGLDLFRQAPIIGHGQAATGIQITEAFRQGYGLEKTFTHFHNGFLTAAVEAGILGVLSLAAIFVVLIATAIGALRASTTPTQTFGGLVILLTAVIYLGTGTGNLILGHDILDTMFLFFAGVGIFLGAGRSILADDVTA